MRTPIKTLTVFALILMAATAAVVAGTLHARRVHIIGCATDSTNMDVSSLGKMVPAAQAVGPWLALELHGIADELRHTFGVGAGVILLREERGLNAFAADTSYPDIVKSDVSAYGEDPADYSDGTVFLGVKLLTSEFEKGQGFAVPSIMAHEFAHIMQNRRRFPYRGKWLELHADYMAGWYTAYRTRHSIQDPLASFASIVQKGDTNFSSPDHHGTPRERGMAFLAGYRDRGTAERAYERGMLYVGRRGALAEEYRSLRVQYQSLIAVRSTSPGSASSADYERRRLRYLERRGVYIDLANRSRMSRPR